MFLWMRLGRDWGSQIRFLVIISEWLGKLMGVLPSPILSQIHEPIFFHNMSTEEVLVLIQNIRLYRA